MDHPEKRTDAEPIHLCLENIKEHASYKKKTLFDTSAKMKGKLRQILFLNTSTVYLVLPFY